MALVTEFVEIPLDQLHREAAVMKADGWRFMQTCAANGEDGVDLYYSFMKNGLARNLKIIGVKNGDPVPSITDLFLAAFVFENEARELFGVDMRDIALDFQGAMYAPAENVPMTIITPEQKAAREKAAKAAAAKAAKEAAGAEGDAEKPAAGKAKGRRIFIMTPERRARLDAKLATMSPEKVAKVEAALKAREAEAAAAAAGDAAPDTEQQSAPAETQGAAKPAADAQLSAASAPTAKVDAELEAKLKIMDPEKAAKVRAALGGEAVSNAGESGVSADSLGEGSKDAELESKLAMMDADKAAKVRAALASGRARNASSKGGE